MIIGVRRWGEGLICVGRGGASMCKCGYVRGGIFGRAFGRLGSEGERSRKENHFSVGLRLDVEMAGRGGGGGVAGIARRGRYELCLARITTVLPVLESCKLDAKATFVIRGAIEGEL